MNESIYVEKNPRGKICIYSVITGRVTKLYEGNDIDEATKILERHRSNRILKFARAIERVDKQVEKALYAFKSNIS